VIARRNDRHRDVDNGTSGTIQAINRDTGVVTVLTDSGGRRELDAGVTVYPAGPCVESASALVAAPRAGGGRAVRTRRWRSARPRRDGAPGT
jgi:hypothetical protein